MFETPNAQQCCNSRRRFFCNRRRTVGNPQFAGCVVRPRFCLAFCCSHAVSPPQAFDSVPRLLAPFFLPFLPPSTCEATGAEGCYTDGIAACRTCYLSTEVYIAANANATVNNIPNWAMCPCCVPTTLEDNHFDIEVREKWRERGIVFDQRTLRQYSTRSRWGNPVMGTPVVGVVYGATRVH